ncbi:natural resistance-associated macrophage protein-domain-containing protein [Lobosporangium transversale]|uniref:Natural resistance-associated macrophage protein-domain-containing protein n=1 Tax=Lobosporangium transversale TaxID=64571 RepID=A0A1Y2GDC6_9FUNG|nr:natural resistance-associated macrophage protein-domain-containing protein [Lobosporangium transversale]ORZ07729.1 natural resistance-associated macrophage protein-domain-containing protein [Lobosporangium transversale]|eukprot:XP_021878095.1 natural resistance-associated macrophage protein-domain-containing protein [Lobosporangium transversale]
MDPGNWATDLAGGSSFGYMLLFVILLSNLMAVILQGLAVKLGVVSGLDLAQACRKFTPKYVNWILYVLAELAIIACDLAEVIGSAIALNLLFKIPLPWGVVITAADVLVILFAFRDDQSVKSRRLFEALVILLVSCVGVCFTAEIVYAQPVAKDVFKGFLPSAEILTNRGALYLAIGIIGATVMPHNLYLHSSIVKLRTSRELTKLASSQASMSSTSNLMASDQRQAMLDEDKGAVSLKHSTIRTTLRYTFVDSTVALTFALYVNSAILIVSAATFKYKFPEVDNEGLADFFDAFHLLSQYLGKAAGYVFAVALLMAGQSSTLTATLAGQIIMEGFLGASYLKPWVRRLLTRCLAIIPALIIVIIKGQSGLSNLLLASQVALSIQLPFAVVPLVLFTSMGRCMTVPVEDNHDKPGELTYGFQYKEDEKTSSVPTNEEHRTESTAIHSHANIGSEAAAPRQLLLHNFANSWWLVIISGIISVVLLSLNFYLLIQTIQGK